MPSAKVIAERLFEEGELKGWTAENQLEEIRGKDHLKRKHKAAYEEKVEVEKKLNESAILKNRDHNRSLRKEVKARENGDEYVVQSALKDDRNCRLSVSRLTAEQTLVELDERVCEAGRVLDLCRYQRQSREEELEKLKWELQHLEDLEEPREIDLDTERDVIRLENAVDKIDIKLNTARIISNKYCEIIARLRTDSLYLPPKLDDLETAVIYQRANLGELKVLAEESVVQRDKAMEEHVRMEQDHKDSQARRKAVLDQTRKEMDRRKEDLQPKERYLRAPRPTLVGDSADYKAAMELQRKTHTQKRILNLGHSFDEIKEVTHANNIEDVLSRIVRQSEVKQELKQRATQRENQRSSIIEDYNSYRQKFRDMKYSGEQTLSRGQRTVADLQDMLNKCVRDNETARENVRNNGECSVNVKQAIMTLMEKLREIKLPSPEHSYTRGDVFDQLDLSEKKLERLMKDIGATTAESTLQEKLQNTEFQSFLLERVGPDNIRVSLDSNSDDQHELHSTQNNESYLSRDDIKKQGQKLVESREPKQNKKKKAPGRKK